MPHYIDQEKRMTPTLVYEAPIDEKTKEIRKMFDVDEETGYPRKYNWRPLAKLGREYRPEKFFEVFQPYPIEKRLSTHLGCFIAVASSIVGIEYKYAREQMKYAIYADYMKKHPERFETVYRPKVREILSYYTPTR